MLRLTADDGAKSAFDEMTVDRQSVLVGAGDIAPELHRRRQHRQRAGHGHAARRNPRPGLHAWRQRVLERHGASSSRPATTRRGAATRRARGRSRAITTTTRRTRTGYFDYFNGVGDQTGPAGDRTLAATTATTSATGTSSSSTASATPRSVEFERLRRGFAAGAVAARRPRGQPDEQHHRDVAQAAVQLEQRRRRRTRTCSRCGRRCTTTARTSPRRSLAQLRAAGADGRDRRSPTTTSASGRSSSAPAAVRRERHSAPIRATSEVRNSTAHGVMKFTLHDDSYDWQFVPVAGEHASRIQAPAPCTARPANQPPVVNAGPDQTIGVRRGRAGRQRDRRWSPKHGQPGAR